jgi:hypothetical protein
MSEGKQVEEGHMMLFEFDSGATQAGTGDFLFCRGKKGSPN